MPFVLLPAVDVADGQAVRLVQGAAGSETSYGDPLAAALAWQNAGARWIHLVDLDAAFGRGSNRALLAEVVATACLVALVLGLTRTGRSHLAAPSVGAYLGAAYWFTSSTSFANPAATVGRVLTDTFAGIAPASVPGFVVAQLIGAVVGTGLLLALYPGAGAAAGDVVVPDTSEESVR